MFRVISETTEILPQFQAKFHLIIFLIQLTNKPMLFKNQTGDTNLMCVWGNDSWKY